MRKVNDAGLALIKEFEGVKPKAYLDPIGKLTVGVGHLVLPDDHIKLGQVITDDRINELLQADLKIAGEGVEDAVGELNDNQYAACVSLAFNIGVEAFQNSSVARLINAGKMPEAADRFLLFNKAGGKVLGGLVRRRKAERALFLTPVDTAVANPPAAVVTEKHDFIQTVTANETVKEVAKSGVTQIGARVSTGLASGGLLAAIDSFVTQHWAGLILAGGLVLLAVVIVLFILWHKHDQQKLTAQINSDPSRSDVRLQ